jgi:uncharacterized metal-binding protein YceD (DUF177 family)
MTETPRSDTPALSQLVVAAHLPDEGATFRIAPDEATRAALAKEFGIVAIPALKASVTLTPDARGGVRVGGHVDGTVRQTCVATLEPFDAPVSEEIEMHFVPEGRLPEIRPGAEIEVGAEELPDPLVNGAVDIGAVVSEFLALGIDPYPRKPGAVFEVPSLPGAEEDSPFSALARLRRDEPKGEE